MNDGKSRTDAQRFDQHVVNNMKIEREVIARRMKQLSDRPEVEMGTTNGNVRRDQSGT